jgi:hypothetical protein
MWHSPTNKYAQGNEYTEQPSAKRQGRASMERGAELQVV